MIDTDKMRAAYATQPLCQKEWTKKEGNNPTMLCAVSALVAFAGVQPDLIHTMNELLSAERWVDDFAGPVLQAEYGMPSDVMNALPSLFDTQENEWRGVQAVLDVCERHNMDELHEDAVSEDRQRFPQFGPAKSDHRPFGLGVFDFNIHAFEWMDGTPTKTKKVAKAVAEGPYAPISLVGSTDFITSGEKALDEYYKLSGVSPLLWTIAVMPYIVKKYSGPVLLHTG